MSTKKRIGKNFYQLFAVSITVLGLVMFSMISSDAFAHSEHGAAPDLEIRSGETEDGDLYFRLTFDHGIEVNGALNGPVHIHSGRPHLIRFVNEGELDHEIHFGRNPDLETRLYNLNLFGPGEGEHSAHGFLGVHLKPGESTVLHIWIPKGMEGVWEMACFIPGHYEMGQKAPIHVISEEDEGHHDYDVVEEDDRHEDTNLKEHHDDSDDTEHHND